MARVGPQRHRGKKLLVRIYWNCCVNLLVYEFFTFSIPCIVVQLLKFKQKMHAILVKLQ